MSLQFFVYRIAATLYVLDNADHMHVVKTSLTQSPSKRQGFQIHPTIYMCVTIGLGPLENTFLGQWLLDRTKVDAGINYPRVLLKKKKITHR
jgi:hypothetical protein